ncbi:MAG: biotin/lipoyl-containing protein, partial [Geodermatophilaceae bacterium]
NFLPAPGTVTRWVAPAGPGVRVDSGVETGSVIGGAFDSLLAKLIVVGSDRRNALERSRRALAEMQVEGLATVLPFHRAVVDDPAFAPEDGADFTVHTRWIETEFDNRIPPYDAGDGEPEEELTERETVVVEVGGRRLEVSLPAGLGAGSKIKKASPRRAGGRRTGAAAGGDALTSPMQGTIVKIAVEDGTTVSAGDLVVVLEAMKMEQPLNAHKDGTITGLQAEVGAVVSSGSVICEIADS